MNEDEVYTRLNDAIAVAGSQRAFAARCNVTPSYINDVVHKRRALSDRILAEIGVIRITQYRKMDAPSADNSAGSANTAAERGG